MVQGQSDFPLLTRSRKISPRLLHILKTIDTAAVVKRKQTGTASAQLDKTKLRTLQEASELILERDDPEFVMVMHRLAVVYHSWDSYDEAETLYRRALGTAEKVFTGPNLELGLLLNNLARVLYDQSKLEQAEEMYLRALDVLQSAVGPEHPKLATPRRNLAKLYLQQDKPELAQRLYKGSVALMEKALGPDIPKVFKSRKKLNRILKVSAIETIGLCPMCTEVITGIQAWENFEGKPIHTACKPK